MAAGTPNYEYLTKSRFYFEFNNKQTLLKSVDGINITIDTAGEGQALGVTKGAKTKTQYAPSGVTNEEITLTFVSTKDNDELKQWLVDCHPHAFEGGGRQQVQKRYSASLVFCNQEGKEKVRFNITNAIPVNYDPGEVGSDSNETFSETITIAHAGLERVNS